MNTYMRFSGVLALAVATPHIAVANEDRSLLRMSIQELAKNCYDSEYATSQFAGAIGHSNCGGFFMHAIPRIMKISLERSSSAGIDGMRKTGCISSEAVSLLERGPALVRRDFNYRTYPWNLHNQMFLAVDVMLEIFSQSVDECTERLANEN